MSVRDLISRGRGKSPVPTDYAGRDHNPFLALHREMNRLFDDVFRGFEGRSPTVSSRFMFESAWPKIEVSETEKEIRVTADIPGMDENDVELLLDNGVLTIRGEKRAENEDKDRQFSERFYGRFERRLSLNSEVEEDKIAASFRNGVLTVTLPRSGSQQPTAKRITINS
ncbi:Hsp20/alpha crystallin family protein [Rhizobium leguminosarum]|uniref:Hsp20/alpha crystallin family protein n=2 Tax=Rhizobium TaxID=379 RepID=A0A444I6G6_RHILE|nr:MULTISPECIES: Hsp20/alpha crystallin family protein [Rhizobium]MBY5461801.1 Hsp20/alpha crystallin family protein [Rhizobium leguminosarum]NKL65952.1 Hsp20 family protein [Rhizobium leguminosarum bv. viciae]RWX07231.1 Hsp20/alpha crystallin family protein [Rhizobium leguminosarum]RWX33894.1 Hsp20/alpha crystallin family protein [Rhizobium leguminosarum]TBC54881.1 Hsp20/alpha crystallin family protein [Rhizobium leguminosarum]